MKKAFLGRTDIQVTELCFGALPLGPLQAKIPEEVGGKLIYSALEQGINFIDTAEMYQTYSYIKPALDRFPGEVIIATKSHAETYEAMEKSIEEALLALGRDYIDIFHLHAARVTPQVFQERAGALRCLKDYKKKQKVRTIGISTHVVDVVSQAAEVEDIDIVFPLINKVGMGIVEGDIQSMLKAIQKVHQAGKGLYAMKALAGGHLIGELKESFDFVRQIPGMESIAVGMVNEKELQINLKLFNDEEIPTEFLPEKIQSNKKLMVSFFCKGCGACIEVCPNQALSLQNGKAVVDNQACLLCGYCSPSCPEFALRLI